MPKYFNLWEMDSSKMPTDPNERMMVIKKLMETTQQYLKQHPGSEWGQFVGENRGYSTGTQSWKEMAIIHQMLAPYVRFYDVHQAVSMEEVGEIFQSMMSMMQPK